MSDHNPGLRPWRDIARRKCRQIMVGTVPVGGDAPITVQTMTNTPTEDVTATVEQIRRCEEAGADIIELGVPFSDPMADGPIIQKAGEKALALGTGLRQVLGHVREFRNRNKTTPIVLMGYANPVERYDQIHGQDAFVRDAAEAGVDGLLIVDYPPEECAAFAAKLQSHGMDLIFLLAPTSTTERMQEVARVASGYVYYVSLKGVTGAGHLDIAGVAEMVPRIKQHVKLPVGVGFGIRDAQTARAVADVSDAVVIGSALVQLLETRERGNVAAAAADFIGGIRAALDS